LTYSTLTSKEKETIDGVEYHMVLRDVTSDSHLVYTGEKHSASVTGRVEKFQNKFRRGVRR
jgi:large subunit ribosomal protein L31